MFSGHSALAEKEIVIMHMYEKAYVQAYVIHA
jgi:hypothetical protein